VLVVVHGQDEDSGLRRTAQKLRRRFDSVHLLHPDVDHRHVGTAPFRQFDSLGAVTGLGDNQQIRVLFQHPPEHLPP
jgi:hypothetical protein